MYEELVEEFDLKKSAAVVTEVKEQKISLLTQELNKVRQSLSQKEQYVNAFKRELGNVVSSMAVGKELEESVKLLYKKYVRGENVPHSNKANEKALKKVSEIFNRMIDIIISVVCDLK
jgi:transcription initiation factor TFIIIB Brf1 subunit/transcription initiation factor TFIIB